MVERILSFAAPVTANTAGGKGTNLARLLQAGFPVPPGFIVSTQAYLDFVNDHQLQSQILERMQGLNIDQPQAVDAASRAICALFTVNSQPAELAGQIISAYHSLSDQRVAVRSSANAEDLPGFAFAGQHDTFLNVVGDQALLDAVKRCWASLWTARAITYRARNGFAPETVTLAVVVQTMVRAEVSGVLFTANPLTGKRHEAHIDASYGLGEAIVSGQVEPDHYVVDLAASQVTERRLGAKQVVIGALSGGGTERIERTVDGRQALPDQAIPELAKIGEQVEAHFGEPQDIEWAWAEGRYFLLQSRPITSLYPLPGDSPPDGKEHIYFNFNAIQGVMEPLTPLGIDALRLLFSGVTGSFGIKRPMERILPQAGGRLFLDFGDLPGDPVLQKFVLNFLESVEPGGRDILIQLIQDGRIPARRVLTPRVALQMMRAFGPLLGSTLSGLLQYRTARERVMREGEAYVEKINARLVHKPGALKGDLATCLRSLEQDLPQAEAISVRAMPLALVANNLALLLNHLLTRWLGDPPGSAMPLLRSLPGNVTVEMNLRLWAAAQAIRVYETSYKLISSQPTERLAELFQQGSLPETAQREIQNFLQQDGMRGVAEIDLGKPRWQEDPTPVFRILQGYLQLTDPNLAPDRIYQMGSVQAEQLIVRYRERLRKTRWGWLRARIFLALARRIRALASLREVPLFYLAKVFMLYRQALLESGRALVDQGVLDHADDIFYIPLTLLKEWLCSKGIDLKAVAREGREIYSREYRRKQMPRVLLSTGEALYDRPEPRETTNHLTGIAVSPGVAEGIARVILDPQNAHLEPGEILVCPSTDPGWTPLFLTAAGLVMEIGGLMTHGSVVAREYGIPAVVGVRNATTQIHTGQRIQVDGNQGWVILA